MANYNYESKLLHLEIKENEDKYISGEKSLDEPLKKTEELFDIAFEAAKKSTAHQFSNDSRLMQLQSKIVRKRAKSYKPDTLVFYPSEFAEKVKLHFTSMLSSDGKNKKLTNQHYSMIWQKLGEESIKRMHTTPTLDFLYGTFSAEPVSPVKRKRNRIEKDKLTTAVKPKTVNLAESTEGQDISMSLAHRIYSILSKCIDKSPTNSVCFYEFVIDPGSFTRTIENIFNVTFLVQEGMVRIDADEQGLPFLKIVPDKEKKRIAAETNRTQSVLSMSIDEWQAIIKKCNFKRPLIPPSKSQLKPAQGKL